MIKFTNVTNLKSFKKECENGFYSVECVGDSKMRITHNLYKNMPYIYGLEEIKNGTYKFYSENDEPFSVLFNSSSTEIEILSGEKNGRKCKADRNLKQFMRILCLANSVLLLFDFK